MVEKQSVRITRSFIRACKDSVPLYHTSYHMKNCVLSMKSIRFDFPLQRYDSSCFADHEWRSSFALCHILRAHTLVTSLSSLSPDVKNIKAKKSKWNFSTVHKRHIVRYTPGPLYRIRIEAKIVLRSQTLFSTILQKKQWHYNWLRYWKLIVYLNYLLLAELFSPECLCSLRDIDSMAKFTSDLRFHYDTTNIESKIMHI